MRTGEGRVVSTGEAAATTTTTTPSPVVVVPGSAVAAGAGATPRGAEDGGTAELLAASTGGMRNVDRPERDGSTTDGTHPTPSAAAAAVTPGASSSSAGMPEREGKDTERVAAAMRAIFVDSYSLADEEIDS